MTNKEQSGGQAYSRLALLASDTERALEAEFQRFEMVCETRSALARRIDREAGGLVDDEHEPVTVEKAGE